jgi:hypothetical protein
VDYIVLRIFPSRIEAEMAADVLGQSKIPCIIKSEDIGMFGTAGGMTPSGAHLLVPSDEMNRAREVLGGMFGED